MGKNWITAVLVFFIKAYQYLLRPLMGNHCRFYPSCSSYAEEALGAHGCIKGTALIIKRLLRCQPFCEGGIDLVPNNHKKNV